MADFRTHLTTSVFLGTAYGAASHLGYEMPLPTSVLAGGLVAIGGVLPDVDSDNAIILRESLSLVSVMAPMMLLHQYREWGWANETIVLACAIAYLVIRFGVGAALRRYTVHRGMWHSIPAAGIAGLLVYLLCWCTDSRSRWCKAGAIMLGYIWHLVLDEINSVESTDQGRVRIKRSFGTALKFFGNRAWPNISTYGKLIALILIAATTGPSAILDLQFGTGPEVQSATPHEHPFAAPDPAASPLPPAYPLPTYPTPDQPNPYATGGGQFYGPPAPRDYAPRDYAPPPVLPDRFDRRPGP